MKKGQGETKMEGAVVGRAEFDFSPRPLELFTRVIHYLLVQSPPVTLIGADAK